jgi:hypothetical protein
MRALSIRPKSLKSLENPHWLVSWGILVCAGYAFIHLETRFFGAFAVLFWLYIYSALMFRVSGRTRTAILVPLLALAMLSVSLTAVANARTMRDRGVLRQPDYQIVGDALRDVGVEQGDYLAVVGNGFDLYFARYARARVVAQIPDADEFWRLNGAELDTVKTRLAALGVKAIVARNRLDGATQEGWRDVNSTNSARFHILRLAR